MRFVTLLLFSFVLGCTTTSKETPLRQSPKILPHSPPTSSSPPQTRKISVVPGTYFSLNVHRKMVDPIHGESMDRETYYLVRMIEDFWAGEFRNRRDCFVYGENNSLIFRHTRGVVEEIVRALDQLKKTKDRQIDVESRIYTLPASQFRQIHSLQWEDGTLYGIFPRDELDLWLTNRNSLQEVSREWKSVYPGQLFQGKVGQKAYIGGWEWGQKPKGKLKEDHVLNPLIQVTKYGPEIRLRALSIHERKNHFALAVNFSHHSSFSSATITRTGFNHHFEVEVPVKKTVHFNHISTVPEDSSLLVALAYDRETIMLVRIDVQWAKQLP